MNGTLPGLLDDNNITSTLPNRNNLRIPPLRNPNPARHVQAPLPLELIDNNHLDDQDRSHYPLTAGQSESARRPTISQPAEHSATRDSKKPHLAISELVDNPGEGDNGQVQLPSFVSLSVVERSPTQKQTILNNDDFPNKRPRLEPDTDMSAHDRNRLLPMPVQKDGQQKRPLLPAMVTGLHEPPPSAALLPSMDLDARPAIQKNSTSKMQVKDILLETQRTTNSRPPEQMLNTPEVSAAELPRSAEVDASTTDIETPSTTTSVTAPVQFPKKDPKTRRTRRKWSEAETQNLLAGVKKHGFGKWKQILNDPAYTFAERTSIDLKDRFRVFAKDYQDGQLEGTPEDDAQMDAGDTNSDAQANKSFGLNGPANKTRRKRHPWTREEDSALLQGVTKYGFQWTSIHDDPDLGLSHRRATDLRDRIRNLFPEGYKHAEARPLRSEVKKAEKAGKKETPAGTLYAPPSQMDSINFSSESRNTNPSGVSPRNVTRRQTTSGRVPSIASLTQGSGSNEISPSRPSAPRRSKTVVENSTSEQSGITLPSLAFDSTNDTDDWDNTLPPFINWDHENQEISM